MANLSKPAATTTYKLRDWIPLDKLEVRHLCSNPNAISLLDEHWPNIQDKVDWFDLCSNPNAIPLLEKHWPDIQDKIDWEGICCNPNTIHLIEAN